MLLCGPATGLILGVRKLDPAGLLIALALVPVVIAVAEASFNDRSGSLAGGLWPGLAASAGLLLLLPQPSLADVRTDVALVGAAVFTGVGAALFCAGKESGSAIALSAKATAALSGAALVFGLRCVVSMAQGNGRPTISLLASLADGLIAWLAVVALERIGPVRWSAQFTLVPLALLLQGLLLLHANFGKRPWIALGLLAVASLYLLLPRGDDEDGDASEWSLS